MSASTMFSAVVGLMAGAAARVLRPAYLPATCAPTGTQLAAELKLAYQRAVIEGYQATRQLLEKRPKKGEKHALASRDIAGNVNAVSIQFAKAASTLDPDGIASELIRLFCVGVPHMNELDNQRRVATVWSALLAPEVVMREKHGRPIALQGLVDIAARWLESGTTPAAKEAHASRATKFISAHPARTYELLTDAAKQHDLDHMKLLSSVIEPVILPLGQYVGARQAAAGVKVDMSGHEPEQKESK